MRKPVTVGVGSARSIPMSTSADPAGSATGTMWPFKELRSPTLAIIIERCKQLWLVSEARCELA